MDGVDDVEIECPYCGEVFGTLADTCVGAIDTVEDCSVCCRPIRIRMTFEDGAIVSVDSQPA